MDDNDGSKWKLIYERSGEWRKMSNSSRRKAQNYKKSEQSYHIEGCWQWYRTKTFYKAGEDSLNAKVLGIDFQLE